MSNALKLQAALAEYSSLRAEILQRNTTLNSMIVSAIASIFGILFLTQDDKGFIRLVYCLVPIAIMLIT